VKNLFEQDSAREIQDRLNNLSPASRGSWGKMTVAQMLAHCAVTMEVATGKKKLPRLFIGRILGPIAKPSYLGPKVHSKNNPTDKYFQVMDERDFEKEKERLSQLIRQFSEGGEAACTRHPHSFFGRMTPGEWARGMYKHLDHHLRQFGV